MFKVVILFVFMALTFSSPLFAIDRDIVVKQYRENISVKGPGVWLTKEFVFFSVNKVCIRKQKYSGSKETRAATAQLLFNIGEHFQSELYTKTIEPEILKERLKIKLLQLNQQHTKSFNVSGMLVADEDIGNCTRRRTMAFDINSYNDAKSSMKTVDIEALKREVIAEAFETNDRKFLLKYTFQLGMLESYISFSIDKKSTMPPSLNHINLDASMADKPKIYRERLQNIVLKFKTKNNCSSSCEFDDDIQYSDLDITNVLPMLRVFNGFVLVDETNAAQQNIAKDYLKKAESNFNQGINPEQIYKDLSVSLLFNPNQIAALNMMGSIARALNKPNDALILHRRALMLAPKSSATLVYIAKTYLQLESKLDASIYINFIISHYQWLLPDVWAKTETTRLAKELT